MVNSIIIRLSTTLELIIYSKYFWHLMSEQSLMSCRDCRCLLVASKCQLDKQAAIKPGTILGSVCTITPHDIMGRCNYF